MTYSCHNCIHIVFFHNLLCIIIIFSFSFNHTTYSASIVVVHTTTLTSTATFLDANHVRESSVCHCHQHERSSPLHPRCESVVRKVVLFFSLLPLKYISYHGHRCLAAVTVARALFAVTTSTLIAQVSSFILTIIFLQVYSCSGTTAS